MYFPYPDHSIPKLTPVGAYHLAESATPVTQVGALGQVPAGYAPIRSPYFPQYTPWPYIKGPNYTRPVFRENTTGAFAPRPIVRMPSLKGLGQEKVTTAEQVCEVVKGVPDAYDRCMRFNIRLVQALPEQADAFEGEMQRARAACLGTTPFDAWARCYYSHLENAWYERPVYLGAAAIAGGAAIGLIIMALRKTME